MRLSNYISANVLCPFYKDSRLKNQMILCEGIMSGTSVHLAFADKGKLRQYIHAYCCDRYFDCVISKMLFEKYETEEK